MSPTLSGRVTFLRCYSSRSSCLGFARLGKLVGCHTFRHAFATHLLEAGHNIRVVQQLMGHKDVETTMIYTHVMSSSLNEVRSSADTLLAIPVEASAKERDKN